MEFLVGIVTYNPLIDQFKEKLLFFKVNNFKVLIVDNGSNNSSLIKSVCKDVGVNFIGNKKNLGIAFALNEIFNYAQKEGYSWVLTLDQDSLANLKLLNSFKKCEDKDDVGIYCPKIHDIISDEYWPVVENDKEFVNIEKCITSGSLTSVAAWRVIGGFDDYLFIDEVDNDFCYRLLKSNYKIMLLPHAILKHKIGNTKIIRVFGIKLSIRNHSPMRKFYITRNRLYLDKKYYGKIRIKTLFMTYLFIIKTIIFEDNKVEKLRSCIRGMKAAFKL